MEELSKEDLELRRKEITEYYSSNIPYLKIQREYEQLLADIEDIRARRLQTQLFLAQSHDGKQSESENNI